MRLKHRHLVFTYPFTIGARNGATRNLYETSSRLAQRGIRVSIVAVARPYDAGETFAFPSRTPATKLPLRITTVSPRHALPYSDSIFVRRAVAEILAQEPADAILSHYHEAVLLPALARKHQTIFGFLSLWQSYEAALAHRPPSLSGLLSLITRLWNRWGVVRSHRQAQILFASSQFTKRELVKVMDVKAERVIVNYFGMNEEFLAIRRRRPEAISRILFFGRLVRTKGVVDAIEALATIAQGGNRRWKYRMRGPGNNAGSDDTHDRVRDVIRKKQLDDLVIVRGPADDQELRQELEAAHLALMPSHIEAFGLSIAEAQAAGLPVVAYAAGSVPEIVEHGCTGWLAKPHDIPQLAGYVAEALAKPQVAYERGLAGRRRIAERFDWERTVSTLIDHVQQLQS